MFGTDLSTKTDPEPTLNLLYQLVQMTPSLERINLDGNKFHDLSASFVQTILSHPKCEWLCLSFNQHLGCSSHRPNTCPVNRLLSQLCVAASSSPLPLRGLSLEGLGMTSSCCGPALERLLLLGLRGLQILNLNSNLLLSSVASSGLSRKTTSISRISMSTDTEAASSSGTSGKRGYQATVRIPCNGRSKETLAYRTKARRRLPKSLKSEGSSSLDLRLYRLNDRNKPTF